MYTEAFRLFIGWFVLCLPTYLILGKWKFNTFEKIIFSFFISYGLTSLLTYWIGKIFNLTIGLFLSFVVLVIIYIFLVRKNEGGK